MSTIMTGSAFSSKLSTTLELIQSTAMFQNE